MVVIVKVHLLSIELTKDIEARPILFIRIYVTKVRINGVEQSIRSSLRTMRHLVYKRRSKRVPETTAESVAAI